MGMQLYKAAFWGMTGLLALALAGLIGYYQGFARAIGIMDLDRSIPALMADGVAMLRDAPSHVFSAGLAGTAEWLVAVAFLIAGGGALAVVVLATWKSQDPDASLEESPATRPQTRRPESPPDAAALATFATAKDSQSIATPDDDADETISLPLSHLMVSLGGTISLLMAVAIAAWTVWRHHHLGQISILNPEVSLDSWIIMARLAAGIDIIALVAGVVWLLYAMRLPRVWAWLKVLTVTLAGISCTITFAAASISAGTMTQINIQRPIVNLANSGVDDIEKGIVQPGMIVGRSGLHVVVLREPGDPYLMPSTARLTVISRMNMPEYLTAVRTAAAAKDAAASNPDLNAESSDQ